MPARNKKAEEKAQLQKRQTITITIDATESNMQRLAALLLFADHLEKTAITTPGPLPWEEVKVEHTAEPLEINYEAVRRGIVKEAERIGIPELVKTIVARYGESLAQVPDDQLIALWKDLEET